MTTTRQFFPVSMEMETEDHYRMRARSYRTSAEYVRMLNLYPILQSSIKDCEDETLVA